MAQDDPNETKPTPTQWWLGADGKTNGPHSHAFIESGLKTGAISPTTFACQVGQQNWKPVREWPEFALTKLVPSAAPTPTDDDGVIVAEVVGAPSNSAGLRVGSSSIASGNPFAPTANPTVTTQESLRLSGWTWLRDIARQQRLINLACVAGIALTGLAKGVGTLAPFVDTGLGMLSAITVTAVWTWLLVMLARALGLNVWLYGILGLVPVVNLFVLLELSGRASATLKSHGIKVGFLGTELPDEPPAWFQQPTT